MDPWHQMESLMNSVMSNPFGDMFGFPRHGGALMPYGFGGNGMFPSMNLFDNFHQMAQTPQCQSYSSSTFVSYTTDGTGQPQVYQSSHSTRSGPGGIRETQKRVHDSRTGLQKMSIGHHMDDKAHVVEKSRNNYTGEEEENQEYLNIEEEEADAFNREWEQRAQRYAAPRSRYAVIGGGRSQRRDRPAVARLAITDSEDPALRLQGHSIRPSRSKPSKNPKPRKETDM